MNIKEKIKMKRNAIREEDKFTNEITRRVGSWIIIYESLTILYCNQIGRIPLDNLLFSIVSGFLICILLNIFVFWIINTLVTQSVSEELASFYFYESTEKERTKLMKKLMKLPASISAVVFVLYICHKYNRRN